MKRILNLPKPLYNLSPFTNLQLSVAQCHADGYLWIYNNFVQLEFSYLYRMNHFFNWNLLYSDGCETNLLNYNIIQLSLLNNLSIIEYIKNCIANSYYIYITVDTYFIKEYSNYNKKHIFHGLIINGFDNDEFYINDYFDWKFSKNGKCSSNELLASIKSYIESNENKKDIQMFKANVKLQYNFSLQLLKIFVDDYLEGNNTYKRILFNDSYCKDYTYGINIYKDIEHLSTNYSDKYYQSFYMGLDLLFKHKKVMIDRILFMKHKKIILNFEDLNSQYENLAIKTQILRNIFIKNSFNKKEEIDYSFLVERIKVIQQEDYEATRKFKKIIEANI